MRRRLRKIRGDADVSGQGHVRRRSAPKSASHASRSCFPYGRIASFPFILILVAWRCRGASRIFGWPCSAESARKLASPAAEILISASCWPHTAWLWPSVRWPEACYPGPSGPTDRSMLIRPASVLTEDRTDQLEADAVLDEIQVGVQVLVGDWIFSFARKCWNSWSTASLT